MKLSNRNNISSFFWLFFCTCASAHQTDTVHPFITRKAIASVACSDESSGLYKEIYSFSRQKSPATTIRLDGPLFSGGMEIMQEDESERQERDLYPAFQHRDSDQMAGRVDMIDGVVWEDIAPDNWWDPFARQRVYSHFYHAYRGGGLWLNDGTPSRSRGEKYFTEAAALYGYLDELETSRAERYWKPGTVPPLQSGDEPHSFDKHLAYFLFGFSLHHLEDMSSVAHVHDDSHLDKFTGPRDDYEGVYLPNHVWRETGGQAATWFFQDQGQQICSSESVESFDDVWPAPFPEPEAPLWGSASLARTVYNGSIFEAKIPTPKRMLGINYWAAEGAPTGELVDMFGFQTDKNTNGTYFTRFYEYPGASVTYAVLLGYAALSEWKLHTPTVTLEVGNDWLSDDIWPVDAIGGPKGYYYIEDHIRSGASDGRAGDLSCDEILSAANGVRGDLSRAYGADNGLVSSTPDGCQNTLLGRFAAEFVPLGIKFAAGYMKWWFDFANTPPYLRRLTVEQKTDLVEERKVKVYDARWRSTSATGAYDEQQWLNGGCNGPACGHLRYRFPFRYVNKRELKQDETVERGFLTSAFPVELLLEFNEPMQIADSSGSYDPQGGFVLGFQPEKKDGPGDDIWLTEHMTSLQYAQPDKNADNVALDGEDKGRIWKVTIPKSVLEQLEEVKKGGPFV